MALTAQIKQAKAYRSLKGKVSHHQAGLAPRSWGNQYTWEQSTWWASWCWFHQPNGTHTYRTHRWQTLHFENICGFHLGLSQIRCQCAVLIAPSKFNLTEQRFGLTEVLMWHCPSSFTLIHHWRHGMCNSFLTSFSLPHLQKADASNQTNHCHVDPYKIYILWAQFSLRDASL